MTTRSTSLAALSSGSESRHCRRSGPRWVAAFLLSLLGAPSCISVPGETPAEQRAHVDVYAEESLAQLVKQSPEVQAALDAAKGYAVVQERGLKLPLIGGEAGWGVVVDKESGKRTYVKQRGFELGAGWGARVVRVISIFSTKEAVAAACDGGFEFSAGAEAGAKAGDVGGGVGGGASTGEGVTVYVLLENGAAATATVGVIRLSQFDALNEPDS